MINWIKLITFSKIHDSYLVKGILENEEIEVLIENEFAGDVNNSFSNASGDIKILVKRGDYVVAKKILIELGYLKEKPIRKSFFLDFFDKFPIKIWGFGEVSFFVKIILFFVLLVSPIIILIAYLTQTSTETLLTQNDWCVTKIYYNKTEVTPNTTGLKMIMRGSNCEETIKFSNNGLVSFPGVNTPSYEAIWKIKDDSIFITEPYNSDHISFDKNLNIIPSTQRNKECSYLGKYSLVIKNNTLKMQSDSILIIGKVIFNYSFN